MYKSSKNSSNIEGITPGDKVYLYHYNERSGMLETVPYGYQAAVDDEGYVTINILHCSSYVIYTKEADASLCLSLREQIKVTPSRITLALAEDADRGKIEVKLPITLEWWKPWICLQARAPQEELQLSLSPKTVILLKWIPMATSLQRLPEIPQ